MIIRPEIELKNIKHTAWASEETHCYQATLYVDGVKWGTVSNQGHGGCDDFHGIGKSYADIKALNKQIAETYPPYENYGMTTEQDLEMLCGDLVNQWLRDKDFARAMKSKVLFTKPDVRGVWQVPVKKQHTLAATLELYHARCPQYTYLADLPVDAAKALYFAGADADALDAARAYRAVRAHIASMDPERRAQLQRDWDDAAGQSGLVHAREYLRGQS